MISLVAASMDGFDCERYRDGRRQHRRLRIPAAQYDNADRAERQWADKLCCVFTHVERDTSVDRPTMVTYDGSVYRYNSNDGLRAASEKAWNGICAMYMGSRDCGSIKDRCPNAPDVITRAAAPTPNPTISEEVKKATPSPTDAVPVIITKDERQELAERLEQGCGKLDEVTQCPKKCKRARKTLSKNLHCTKSKRPKYNSKKLRKTLKKACKKHMKMRESCDGQASCLELVDAVTPLLACDTT